MSEPAEPYKTHAQAAIITPISPLAATQGKFMRCSCGWETALSHEMSVLADLWELHVRKAFSTDAEDDWVNQGSRDWAGVGYRHRRAAAGVDHLEKVGAVDEARAIERAILDLRDDRDKLRTHLEQGIGTFLEDLLEELEKDGHLCNHHCESKPDPQRHGDDCLTGKLRRFVTEHPLAKPQVDPGPYSGT